MKYSGFNEAVFRLDVDEALRQVNRILNVHRNPRLAEDVDHVYDNKYDLANMMTNVGIIAHINCLERIGLTADIIRGLDQRKRTTLRFKASDTCSFIKETEVAVPMERTIETAEGTQTNSSAFSGNSTKTTISRVVNRVKEYHWRVDVNWELSIYSGANPEKQKTILQERKSSTIVVVQSAKTAPIPTSRDLSPIDVSLTWLLRQIDTKELVSQFKIDTQHPDTKTPRRNKQVQDALNFMEKLNIWTRNVHTYVCSTVQRGIVDKHNPAGGGPPVEKPTRPDSPMYKEIFNPIQPLMEYKNDKEGPEKNNPDDGQKSILTLRGTNHPEEESRLSPLFSRSDISKIVNEHVHSLDEKLGCLQKMNPSKHVISSVEAGLVLICGHLDRLREMYTSSVGYIEWMLEQQLVAAIGKQVDSADLDKFVRFHNAKLLDPAPKPFSHSIRRPNHYPDGVLSIEGYNTNTPASKKEPIDTFVREVKMLKPLKVPLNAASTLELTGQTFLHGWLQHRFQNTCKKYELIARARQFSSFMLIVGTMLGSNELDPKDAIILQNKDEVVIPLLLNELPSAKEFKDAIQSLSPEQQRFAMSFRSMQLESSVLGVCIIQIKPQLEKLLGLPPDALTKEMKLTQDLMELFVKYQVPSDLLSYDGETEDASNRDKVENVKAHVTGVLDVVERAKAKQLREQSQKANMAASKALSDAGLVSGIDLNLSCSPPSVGIDRLSYAAPPPPPGNSSWFSGWGPTPSCASPPSAYASPPPPPPAAAQAPPPMVFSRAQAPPTAFAQPLRAPPPPPRSIHPGGFHSSTSDRVLMAKYGHAQMQKSKTRSPDSLHQAPPPLVIKVIGAGNALSNTKSMVAASKEVGVSTLEELQRQRDVIQNIEKETDRNSGAAGSTKPTTAVATGAVDARSTPDGNSPIDCPDDVDQVHVARHSGASRGAVDFSSMPKVLDSVIEQHDNEGSLCSTVIKTAKTWTRRRQEDLLSSVRIQMLESGGIKSEKDKAFDLLDALSRSGSLPIACTELHVIICLTHRFEQDVMGTIIQDNINPIEKLEMSSLLFASTIHGIAPKDLVRDPMELSRMSNSFPLLLE